MSKPKIKCPTCAKEIITKDRFLRGDLIQHLWMSHKIDAPKAHEIVDKLIQK